MANTIDESMKYGGEIAYKISESMDLKSDVNDFVEILLVEDNIADTRLVEEIFKDLKINTKIHIIEDGVEALNYLYKNEEYRDAQKPDIIILDMNLPKKDGIEVLYEIKTDKNLKYIPTIVLTSSYGIDEIEDSYCRYINCYIAKPFYLDQYVDIVLFIKNFQLTASKLPEKVNMM